MAAQVHAPCTTGSDVKTVAVHPDSHLAPTAIGEVELTQGLHARDHASSVLAHVVRFDPGGEPDHSPAGPDRGHGEEEIDHPSSVASTGAFVHTGAVPEILEVETYRRSADVVVGRRVKAVSDPDPIVCVDRGTFGPLVGRRVNSTTRRGKVMTIHFSGGLSLDLHFGMSGRLVVDGDGAIDRLVYGASDGPGGGRWDRFALVFGRGSLVLSDPRRFARVRWHEGYDGLGVDAFDLEERQLSAILVGRRAPVKAVLLDQTAVAGLGNMLVDEILWRASIRPDRRADDLSPVERRRIHREITRVLPDLLRRGGSHAGRLSYELREPGSRCPRDGSELSRLTCGGRTTYWCPGHQV